MVTLNAFEQAGRSKNTYYGVRYRRIAGKRPIPTRLNNTSQKQSGRALIALVSLQHKMLIDAWNMLVNGAFYREPGPDYYTRHNPGQTKAKAIKQLENLGYSVTLEPLTGAA